MLFASRRLVVVAAFVALPLLASCGGSNSSKPRTATATATRPPATATRTNVPDATATSTFTGVPATATSTFIIARTTTATATIGNPTATSTVANPTSTSTSAPPTSTATAPSTSTATVTATRTATGTPVGTASATVTTTATETGTPVGTATATVTATFTPTGTPVGTASATVTGSPTGSPTPVPENFRDLSVAGPAPYVAHSSVTQIYVTGATPGQALELVDADGLVVRSADADAQGSLILRDLPIAAGYHVVSGYPGAPLASAAVASMAMDDAPDQSFYDQQQIGRGYGYLQTRDGTLLSIMVYMPGPPENGPYATLIEYSGYDPANPDSAQPSTLIATTLGYAVVGVNIRGTGCSGGAFQFFEPLQSTDGYDAVEAIAAQPWVKHHHVGMVGISYPGISQLFVAQLRPPHLAAIAPLSVVSDTGRGTLYPGGILNNGFATDWAADRAHDAQPGGQHWSQVRMDEGDQVCIANMTLRGQTPDILQMISDNAFYVPAVADPVSPVTFVHKIDVPVFLAGALQDEQTGPYWPTMIDQFDANPKAHFTIVNGNHTEALIPAIFSRWMEFLSLYIRPNESPKRPPIAAGIVAYIAAEIYKSPALTLPPDRFANASYAEALATFEADPRVRVLFESGAGSATPGAPVPAFEHNFDRWPVPGIEPTAWYLSADGDLAPEAPAEDGADSFLYDPEGSQLTSYHGGGDDIWSALPNWQWEPQPEGKAVAYATAPFAEDTVLIGSGSADLWIKANADDVDLQVTVSEIRPDGKETFVQSGWLRASRRKLNQALSTDLRPVFSGFESDAAPLPADEYALTRIEIFPIAYAFRAGSRLRIVISPPGHDRPLWKFASPDIGDDVVVEIARSAEHPSRVLLPVVPGLVVPTGLPVCPSQRGEPCRTYVELSNTPAS